MGKVTGRYFLSTILERRQWFGRPIVLWVMEATLVKSQSSERIGKPRLCQALLELRNALVHFKPEWFNQQGKHSRLSNKLAARLRSPWFPEPEPLFPRAWASAECAKWACNSVKDLIIDFEDG